MSVFEVRIEGDDRVVVSGELDLATAPQLTSAIEALAGTWVQRVVVDLAAVTFMDSSGVAALCRAQEKLAVEGTVLVLSPISRQVQATFHVLGLDHEFVRE
jgi:anti-sigma B factor antagonist